jgi:hypothetical protein
VDCTIAIAPHGYAETSRPLDEIGVGYDGSPESEHALATARELPNRAGAAIKALRVVSRQDVREAEPVPADWPVVDCGVSRYLVGHAACPLLVLAPTPAGAGSVDRAA